MVAEQASPATINTRISNMRKSNQNIPDFAPPRDTDSGFKIKVDSVRNKFDIDLELNNVALDAKSNCY